MDPQTQPQTQNVELAQQYDAGDPFAQYAQEVDTAYPIIPGGSLQDMRVKKIERSPNKENTGEKIAIQLETTADNTSVKGEPVPAGFVIMHNVGVTPTEKNTKQMIAKSIGSLLQAAQLNMRIGEFIQDPSALKDRIIRCKIGIQAETDEFPARNTIKAFVKV